MKLAALTRSRAFARHLQALQPRPVVADRLPRCEPDLILLLHLPSLREDERDRLDELSGQCRVVACSDQPQLAEMLRLLPQGIAGYANSFMAPDNFAQLLSVVDQGQVWLPPGLQQQAFALAQQALKQPTEPTALSLDELTEREAEVARAVAEGLSNREIAERHGIAERTVKAHLSSIYRKLGVRDRKALMVGLRAA